MNLLSPSPRGLTETPWWAATDSSIASSCWRSAFIIESGACSHMWVLPSTSVKRNVTTPSGSSCIDPEHINEPNARAGRVIGRYDPVCLLPKWSFTPTFLAWALLPVIPLGAALEGINERLLEVPLLVVSAGWAMLAVAALSGPQPDATVQTSRTKRHLCAGRKSVRRGTSCRSSTVDWTAPSKETRSCHCDARRAH